METKTTFDLNTAIETWRTQLSARETIPLNNLRELEAHLREAIASWTTKGATEEEAFYLASCRFGKPAQIAAEFEKEDPMTPWRWRLFWMFLGVLSLRFISDLGEALGAILSTFLAVLSGDLTSDELFATGRGEFFQFFQLVALASAPFILYFFSKRIHTAKGAPWKRAFLWLGASRPRLIVATISLLLAAHLATVIADQWRLSLPQPDSEEYLIFKQPTETASAISSQLGLSMLYPMLLLVIMTVVAPINSDPRWKISEK